MLRSCGGSLNVKTALMCLSPIRRQRDCMMVRIHVIQALMCLTGLLSSISQGILCMDIVHMSYGRQFVRLDKVGETTVINAYEKYIVEI